MRLAGKLKQLTDLAKAYASSPEGQAQLAAARSKAHEIAASDAARGALAKGRKVSDEVLGRLEAGDSPIQAAARVARKRVSPPAPDEPTG